MYALASSPAALVLFTYSLSAYILMRPFVQGPRLVVRCSCRPDPLATASSPFQSLFQIISIVSPVSFLRCDAPNRAYTVGWVPLASRIMMGTEGLAFFMAG